MVNVIAGPFPSPEHDDREELETALAHVTRTCAHLRDRAGALVGEMCQSMAAELPDYRTLNLQRRDGLRSAVRAVFDVVVAAIEAGSVPSTDRILWIGRTRAEQGVSIESLLRGVALAQAAGWAEITSFMASADASPAVVRALAMLGQRLQAAIGEVSRRMEAGHRLARERQQAPADHRRADVLRDILLGRFISEADIAGRALTLGMDLHQPHALLLLAGQNADDDRTSVRQAAAALHREISGSTFAPVADGPTQHHLAILMPVGENVAWCQLTLRLGRLLPAAVCGVVAAPPGRHSPTGLYDAHARLRGLLPMAAHLYPERIVTSADTELISVLTSDPARISGFVHHIFGRLMGEEPSRRATIIEAVRAYYASGHRVRNAAHSKRLSDTTMRARLARFTELTGRDLIGDQTQIVVALALVPLVSSAGASARRGVVA